MITAAHTTTGHQTYFTFFLHHTPQLLDYELPSVDGSVKGINEAHAVVKETKKMAWQYRTATNRARKKQEVNVGSLVWVKTEMTQPSTSRKLNRKRHGPYRVVKVICDVSAYVLQNMFEGTEIQRAAGKVKPYCDSKEWPVGLQEINVMEEDEDIEEPIPPRQRQALCH